MSDFPDELRMNAPERHFKLVQEFYEKHHSTQRDISVSKDDTNKLSFFKEVMDNKFQNKGKVRLCVDLGARGGALSKELLDYGNWIGVDADRNAVELANSRGIPSTVMDLSVAIDFKDESFDTVLMAEVMEHLPFPRMTVQEIHRILKKDGGVFLGSVPLDYHLHRRWSVMRGRRLEADPTHIHHFSFEELDHLLKNFFNDVVYHPLRGTVTRHPWLSLRHFCRDIAFVAWNPKADPEELAIRVPVFG